MTHLSFFGAAGTVTGSCSMIEAMGAKFLIDCGMFQGSKTVRALNDEPFPFDASQVDFLLLTHAHIDHSGLLPKLIKHGFTGPIYCTKPTADLLSFMLLDSAKIQKSNAERKSRKNKRRGLDPVEPTYEEVHAKQTLKQLRSVKLLQWVEPHTGIEAKFWNAGHILGSASIELRYPDKKTGNTMRLLFSGDLGPEEKVFHHEPGGDQGFDYIVCESTYGDRDRDDYTLETRRDHIRQELQKGLERGGNVVIPCFAVERSQELLHDIGWLLDNKLLPNCTVFLDSPLATKVTKVFIKHANKLDDIAVKPDTLFRHKQFRLVEDVEESKNINKIKSGAIIISASGMADAGRIQHHIKNNVHDRNSTILFVGYQAPGTLGHVISNGKKDIRIHSRMYKVRSQIAKLGNYSAHADQVELLDWVQERGPIRGGVFLNHGDDDARKEMRSLLAKRGIPASRIHMPKIDEGFDLTAGTPESKGRAKKGIVKSKGQIKVKGRTLNRIPKDQLLNDWHNDYAAFMGALTNKIEAENDPVKKRALIKKLQKSLGK
ncbi:MAG: MBL fold metallo-hydrolase [Nitratireductor sp.]